MTVQLPDLPYAYDALEPVIDELTMRTHHTKHHAGYTAKYNAAVEGTPYADRDITDVLRELQSLPSDIRTAVRNNGGGYVNHTLFWESITPDGSDMPASLEKALTTSFGSVDAFKEQFGQAAATQFGSGWAWLCAGSNGTLTICATPNQDNPLMQEIGCGCTPILGLDVWEHAYYLNYQNRRADYITARWDVVNWTVIADRLAAV